MRKLRAFVFATMIHANGGEGGGGNPAPAPAPANHAPEPETFSKEYVKELRQENASYRTRAQEAEKKAQEAEDRAKKAGEDAEGKVKEATTAAEKRIIRAELKAEAIKAGIVDLDGLSLADLSGVKIDENGEVVGGKEAIEKLKESKPYLFGTKKSTSSKDEPPKPKDQGQPKSARDMDKDEWKKKKRELGLR